MTILAKPLFNMRCSTTSVTENDSAGIANKGLLTSERERSKAWSAFYSSGLMI